MTDHIRLQLPHRAMPLLETLRLSAALRARNRALREEQGAPFREGTHRDREKEPSPYFRCARPLATGMLTPVGPTQKASKHGPKPCNYSSPGWSTFHVVDRSYLHQFRTLLPLRLPLPPFLLTTALNRHHPFFTSPLPPLHLSSSPLRRRVSPFFLAHLFVGLFALHPLLLPLILTTPSHLVALEERQHRFCSIQRVRSSVSFRVSMKRVIGTGQLRYVPVQLGGHPMRWMSYSKAYRSAPVCFPSTVKATSLT